MPAAEVSTAEVADPAVAESAQPQGGPAQLSESQVVPGNLKVTTMLRPAKRNVFEIAAKKQRPAAKNSFAIEGPPSAAPRGGGDLLQPRSRGGEAICFKPNSSTAANPPVATGPPPAARNAPAAARIPASRVQLEGLVDTAGQSIKTTRRMPIKWVDHAAKPYHAFVHTSAGVMREAPISEAIPFAIMGRTRSTRLKGVTDPIPVAKEIPSTAVVSSAAAPTRASKALSRPSSRWVSCQELF
jgi:hypothetical protein